MTAVRTQEPTANAFAGRLDRAAGLDVDAGARPAAPVECEGCEVLVEGYVANRDELRLRFGAGRQTRDAELIAHAFRAWGRGLHEHVLGEFAAVIADRRAGVALLTHDSLGLRPLFHVQRGDGLEFSTRLADLVDEAAVADLDEEYIADYVALGRYTNERTPYRPIKRLLPGRSLWWSGGRLEHVRGWELAGVGESRCRDDAEYAEAFRALLTEAVRGALPARGVAWSDLSGGLDSSSVVSIAARLGAPGLAAYSIVLPGFPEADEQRWMRAVVEHHELPWQRLDLETALPFARLPTGFLGEPTPAAVDGAQVRAKQELLGAHDVTTMLTGYGGDISLGQFGGPVPPYLADPLFDGRPVTMLRGVRDWKAGARESRSYMYWFLRGVVQPAVDHVRGRSRVRGSQLPPQPWIEPDYLRRMGLEERSGRPFAPRGRHPGVQWAADAFWCAALAMGGVPQVQRSYDVRSPLLYRPLVEFMYGIPWQQRMRPDCDRYLQRHALKGILPELVRNRTSKGTGSRVIIEGLRRSPDWFEYLTDEPLIAEHGIADADNWRLAVRQARVGQTNGDQFFEAGVAIEAWLKQLREHRRAAAPS